MPAKAEAAEPGLELDPDAGAFVAIFGRKGSGKSELAKSYFQAYPYDRIVFDSNGDVDPEGKFTIRVGPGDFEWPTLEQWAEMRRDNPELAAFPSLLYEIDFTDDALMAGTRIPRWLFLVDQVVKKAYHLGRPVCIWLDEIGELAPAGRTPGNISQALHKGRHVSLALLMAGPRPTDIDVLVLSQADIVIMFDVPHDLDRERLAKHLALKRAELDPLLDNLEPHGEVEGVTGYLAFFAATRSLAIFPPLEL